MIKTILLPALISLCLILIGIELYADTNDDIAVKMQVHIDKVRISSPQKYNEMLQKAGNNITDCLSCHKELFEEKESRSPSRFNR